MKRLGRFERHVTTTVPEQGHRNRFSEGYMLIRDLETVLRNNSRLSHTATPNSRALNLICSSMASFAD